VSSTLPAYTAPAELLGEMQQLGEGWGGGIAASRVVPQLPDGESFWADPQSHPVPRPQGY